MLALLPTFYHRTLCLARYAPRISPRMPATIAERDAILERIPAVLVPWADVSVILVIDSLHSAEDDRDPTCEECHEPAEPDRRLCKTCGDNYFRSTVLSLYIGEP